MFPIRYKGRKDILSLLMFKFETNKLDILLFPIPQTEVQLHLFILWNHCVPNDLAAFKCDTVVSIQIFQN